MVLSASSVWSYKVQRRRLLRRGAPPAAVADASACRPRSSPAGCRCAGSAPWPTRPTCSRWCCCWPDGVRRHRGQRQPELARRRLAGDPALRGRQAGPGAVGRPHLRQQGAPPPQPAPARGAGGAGPAAGDPARRGRSRPRHRPGLLRDPARHALGRRRPRPALRAGDLAGRRGGHRAGADRHRAGRADHHLRRPLPGLPRHRLAARPRPVRALLGRLVRPGHRGQPAEVGRPARGAHRLHLRRARRGARPRRHPAGRRRCS